MAPEAVDVGAPVDQVVPPRACSGAMKAGVPSNWPCMVPSGPAPDSGIPRRAELDRPEPCALPSVPGPEPCPEPEPAPEAVPGAGTDAAEVTPSGSWAKVKLSSEAAAAQVTAPDASGLSPSAGGAVGARLLGLVRVGPDPLGQPPVEHDHLAEVAQHDVLTLEVAVDDAARCAYATAWQTAAYAVSRSTSPTESASPAARFL